MLKAYNTRDKFEGKTILITGGLGFVGSNLAARLVDYDSNVTILTRSKTKQINVKGIESRVEIVPGEITDYSLISSLVEDKDYVFHLAAQTSRIMSMESPLIDVESNVKGTLTVLDACRNKNPGASVASVGSVTQIGKALKQPVDETHPERPITIYDADKLICERYFQIYHNTYDLHTVFLRLSTLYGERQQIGNTQTGIVNFFIGKALQGNTIDIFGTPTYLRDFLYIEDVVDALLLSVSDPNTAGEALQVCSGKSVPFIEMVNSVISEVKEQTGREVQCRYLPWPKEWKTVDPGDFVGTFGKLNKATGWYPRIGLEEGIKRTVAFYKDNLGDYLNL